MAKTNNADAAAVKQLKSDLSAGTLGQLYIFHGEEAYLRDFYLGQMKKKLLPGGMEQLSLFERFNAFVNGVFDMTAIVYYLSVIGFFLFLSVQSLEKRRYN